MFSRIFIVRRGQAAIRVARTCKRLGITAVALRAPEGSGLHIEACDISLEVDVTEGMLDVEQLVARAVENEIDAVHPGFGRHRQRDAIARALEQQGLPFVGQDADAAAALTDRTAFRALVEEVGGRVIPGSEGAVETLGQASLVAEEIGYPVVLGPAEDGDDPSWTIVDDEDDLPAAFEKLQGQGPLAVEKWLPRARAVELIVAIDAEGEVAPICDREETLFAEGRSLIEECPSTAFVFRTDGQAIQEMAFDLALRIAKQVTSAGLLRVGLLVDEAGRLYVSHADLGLPALLTAAEMVTGLDLVGLEMQLAAGVPMPDEVLALQPSGHAISAQLMATGEADPEATATTMRFPAAPQRSVRVEQSVMEGFCIPPDDFPRLAKITAYAPIRHQAALTLDRMLAGSVVAPYPTNCDRLRSILNDESFRAGQYDASFFDKKAS
ncbi:MAG: ATP-grasp domain-containing protein [Deltaproteobacteria bacterium]|nr:ATP-grasp domain-containing protein [Deltaproteobacteria bacterium]